MDDRSGLIERAAALLRESAGQSAASATAGRIEPAAPPSEATPPLSRSIVLDRNSLAQTGIVMPWTATARVVEEFRIAKRNIMLPWQSPDYREAADRPPRVVMVTSSRPREGKTFCSINLALAFAAEENLVTVLIDADPVRGDTAKTMKLPQQPGLTDILSGKCRLDEALVQTDLPNLVLLPPGGHGPQVPELLTGLAPGLLFAEIARRYPRHVILLDTAPCLASTDPAALAAFVSQIVFVVEAEHTQQGEIESSLSLLSRCQNISFLLNKAPAASSEHFGAYTYYYGRGKLEAKAGED